MGNWFIKLSSASAKTYLLGTYWHMQNFSHGSVSVKTILEAGKGTDIPNTSWLVMSSQAMTHLTMVWEKVDRSIMGMSYSYVWHDIRNPPRGLLFLLSAFSSNFRDPPPPKFPNLLELSQYLDLLGLWTICRTIPKICLTGTYNCMLTW